MLPDRVCCQVVSIWGGPQIQGVILGGWVKVVVFREHRHIFSDVPELGPFSVGCFMVDRPEADFYTGPIELVYIF